MKMLLISNRISTFFSGTCFCQSFKNQWVYCAIISSYNSKFRYELIIVRYKLTIAFISISTSSTYCNTRQIYN